MLPPPSSPVFPLFLSLDLRHDSFETMRALLFVIGRPVSFGLGSSWVVGRLTAVASDDSKSDKVDVALLFGSDSVHRDLTFAKLNKSWP